MNRNSSETKRGKPRTGSEKKSIIVPLTITHTHTIMIFSDSNIINKIVTFLIQLTISKKNSSWKIMFENFVIFFCDQLRIIYKNIFINT